MNPKLWLIAILLEQWCNGPVDSCMQRGTVITRDALPQSGDAASGGGNAAAQKAAVIAQVDSSTAPAITASSTLAVTEAASSTDAAPASTSTLLNKLPANGKQPTHVTDNSAKGPKSSASAETTTVTGQAKATTDNGKKQTHGQAGPSSTAAPSAIANGGNPSSDDPIKVTTGDHHAKATEIAAEFTDSATESFGATLEAKTNDADALAGTRSVTKAASDTDDDLWLEWTPWNQCTVTCGGGTYARMKMCRQSDLNCSGKRKMIEVQSCNDEACPGGIWLNWLPWSTPCNQQCRHTRRRLCKRVAANSNSPSTCHGPAVQETECDSCPHDTNNSNNINNIDAGSLQFSSDWSAWTEWSRCGRNCTKSRVRQCAEQGHCVGAVMEGADCFDDDCQPLQHVSTANQRTHNRKSKSVSREEASEFWWRTPSARNQQATTSAVSAAVSNSILVKTPITAAPLLASTTTAEQMDTAEELNSGWMTWEEWQRCDCRTNKRIRLRACPLGLNCKGRSMQTKACDDESQQRCGRSIG